MTAAVFLESIDKVYEGLQRDLRYIGNEEFKGRFCSSVGLMIGHCLTCRDPIVGKVTSFTQKELKSNFHPGCFLCSHCKASMEGKAFYIHEDKYLDQECYHKVILGNCDACQKSFTDATIIKASGKQYHPDCFTCNTCSKVLTGSYIEKDGVFFCKVFPSS